MGRICHGNTEDTERQSLIRKFRIFCVSGAVFCLVFFAIYSTGFAAVDYEKQIKQEQKSLKKIETDIKKKKKEVKKAKKKEENLIVELAQINKKLKRTQKDLDWLKTRLARTQRKLRQSEQDLKNAEAEAEQWQKILARRLRRIYKEKQFQAGAVELLAAASAVDFAKKYTLLKSVTAQTSELFCKAVEKKQAVEEIKSNLERQRKEIQELKGKTAAKEKKLKEQKLAKNKILRKIKRKRRKDELQIARLTQSAKDLEKLIGGLKKKAARQKLLAARGKKGEYIWPAQGKVVSRFGKYRHPGLNTYLINQGINIQSPEGQSVIAIERGNVLFVGEFQAYGQMVILNHGGELYTVYAHLKEIMVAPNQKVERGQIIGTVGSTGLSLVEGANLYFEVRKNGIAENPLVWLK